MSSIIDKIRTAGVVGSGGAGFPTHVKASCEADVAIINAAECEPLLCNDKELLLNKPEQVLQGLSLVADAVGANRRVVAIKNKYHDVIERLKSIVPKFETELFLLQDFYPAGDEHEIVNYVTGRIVPEMGIPPSVGVVVNNVETLLNVFHANSDQPVITRYVTVGGAVAKPAVFIAPIGTPVHDLLAKAGGIICEDPVFILGGIMMGQLCDDASEPISKTTSAIIVLPRQHPLVLWMSQSYKHSLTQAQSACTQCVMCTDVCNRYLLGHRLYPHLIMRTVDLELEGDSRLVRSAFLCSECGCCEYACPMHLSPRKVNQVLKQKLSAKGIRYETNTCEPELHYARPDRRIPVKRIISRHRLTVYDKYAALDNRKIDPKVVRIPLKQHIGAPAECKVAIGDKVTAGQVIGEIPDGQLGARVHASIEGIVRRVNKSIVEIEAKE